MRWYLSDHLGTVRDLADAAGEVIDHIAYDSFGNVLAESNPAAGDRFRFTGREFDAATGQYYYRARYYDGTIGRFTSEDPLGLAACDVNLYRYVSNRPTAASDPSGRKPVPPPPGPPSRWTGPEYAAWYAQYMAYMGQIAAPVVPSSEPSFWDLYWYYLLPGHDAPADPWLLNVGSEIGWGIVGVGTGGLAGIGVGSAVGGGLLGGGTAGAVVGGIVGGGVGGAIGDTVGSIAGGDIGGTIGTTGGGFAGGWGGGITGGYPWRPPRPGPTPPGLPMPPGGGLVELPHPWPPAWVRPTPGGGFAGGGVIPPGFRPPVDVPPIMPRPVPPWVRPPVFLEPPWWPPGPIPPPDPIPGPPWHPITNYPN